MNVKRHFKVRYLQRIEGLSDDQEIKRALATRDDYLTDSALKMYEHSRFLWRGQLGDNITRSYWINGDLILVTDVDETCLITLYRADFGFPPETNRRVIQDLIGEIEELRSVLCDRQRELNDTLHTCDRQIDEIDARLKELEAQMELLRQQKKVLQEERAAAAKEAQPILREIDRYAVMLCNTVQYRNDLVELRKTGA